MVHFIGHRQPAPQGQSSQLMHQGLALAAGTLIGEQQPIPAAAIALATRVLRVPFLEHQSQPLGGLAPLAGDGAAVAEDQEMVQVTFGFEATEAQQGSEGFAGTRAGMNQHVPAPGAWIEQPRPQQLDQLALPVARLHRCAWGLLRCGTAGAEVKGGDAHGRHCAGKMRKMSGCAYGVGVRRLYGPAIRTLLGLPRSVPSHRRHGTSL